MGEITKEITYTKLPEIYLKDIKTSKHKWQIEKNIANRYDKRLTAFLYKELLQSLKKNPLKSQ